MINREQICLGGIQININLGPVKNRLNHFWDHLPILFYWTYQTYYYNRSNRCVLVNTDANMSGCEDWIDFVFSCMYGIPHQTDCGPSWNQGEVGKQIHWLDQILTIQNQAAGICEFIETLAEKFTDIALKEKRMKFLLKKIVAHQWIHL